MSYRRRVIMSRGERRIRCLAPTAPCAGTVTSVLTRSLDSLSSCRTESGPDELVPGQPADQPPHLQDAERGHDLRGGQAGADDQLVDADGAVVELAQERPLLVGEGQLGGVADRRSRRARCGPRGPAGRAPRGCRRPSRRAGRRRGSGGGSPGWPGCRPGRGRRRPRGSAPSRGGPSRATRSAGVASTTTTPRQRPEMIRLRCGKRPASGPWRIGSLAEQGARARRPRAASSSCSGG